MRRWGDDGQQGLAAGASDDRVKPIDVTQRLLLRQVWMPT